MNGLAFVERMTHMRQSRPDSGLGFQVNGLMAVQVVPFLLGSGEGCGVSVSRCV